MPTVLALLDVPAPPGLQGQSLLLSWQGGGALPYVFMEAGTRRPSQLVVRKGPWKLVQFRALEDRQRFGRNEIELYDLSKDPGEERDVRAEHPEIERELEAALAHWVATTPQHRPTGTSDPAKVDERTRQMLKGLGYVK